MATFLPLYFFALFSLSRAMCIAVSITFFLLFSSSSNFQFENFLTLARSRRGSNFSFFEVEEFKWGKIPRGKFHSSDDLSEAKGKKRWRERLRSLLASEKGKKKRSWNFPMNDEKKERNFLCSPLKLIYKILTFEYTLQTLMGLLLFVYDSNCRTIAVLFTVLLSARAPQHHF